MKNKKSMILESGCNNLECRLNVKDNFISNSVFNSYISKIKKKYYFEFIGAIISITLIFGCSNSIIESNSKKMFRVLK